MTTRGPRRLVGQREGGLTHVAHGAHTAFDRLAFGYVHSQPQVRDADVT